MKKLASHCRLSWRVPSLLPLHYPTHHTMDSPAADVRRQQPRVCPQAELMYAGMPMGDVVNGDTASAQFIRHLIACVGALHLGGATMLFLSTQMTQYTRSQVHLCCLVGNVLQVAATLLHKPWAGLQPKPSNMPVN